MNLKSQNGGILLATLSFICLLAVAAASILELTMNSYRLTMRNELRVQAREVAESEMENMYYQFVTQILANNPATLTPTLLAGIADESVTGDRFPILTDPPRDPFLLKHRQEGWRVWRSISHNPAYDYFVGTIPGTTKRGQVTYVTARIQVLPSLSSPFRNELAVRVGRRFSSTNSSIFQYGVFYQGDMELAPGGAILINGSVAANGSIYAGAQAGGSLTFGDKVRYLSGSYFDKDSLDNVVLRKPGTLVSGGGLIPPGFSDSQANQLQTMSEPENLVGGVDVAELVHRRPDLFPTENDVYRAAILPPPWETDEYNGYDNLQGDDPTIAAQRMYTRAGLRITVSAANVVTIRKDDGTDVTVNYTGDVVDETTLLHYGPILTETNKPVYDQREGKNVAITTINMQALMIAVRNTSNYSPGANDFNGGLYVNLQHSDPTTPRAIRLINGAEINGRKGNGISVTTNGGIYVQGDYNTKRLDGVTANLVDPSEAVESRQVGINPALLMGDQVTVVSAGWDDANAALPKTSRPASADIRIQAGILTGNTSSSASVASGGVQSLVRYLEAWGVPSPGNHVLFFGSLGRLFESKTFTASWNQPGAGQVYGTPVWRHFTFDQLLRDRPPAGSPTTIAFSRGSFFSWNP